MSFIDILISLVLAFIMFAIGTSLKPSDFTNIASAPKALTIGLILQLLFLPIFAFLILFFADLDPLFKVGLFIVALCPGGTTSNFISYIVKAEVALSISLTIINSIIILISIPVLSNFAVEYFIDDSSLIDLPIGDTLLQVSMIVLLPAVLGMIFRLVKEEKAIRIQQVLKYVNVVLLALVFFIKFVGNKEIGGSGIGTIDYKAILPYALIIHLGAMIISFIISRYLSLKSLESITIGIEVGLQNTTLAILITGTLLDNNEMTKPALVFATFSFFTTLVFALITRKSVAVDLAQ